MDFVICSMVIFFHFKSESHSVPMMIVAYFWQRVGGSWDGYWLAESLLHDGDAFAGGLAY